MILTRGANSTPHSALPQRLVLLALAWVACSGGRVAAQSDVAFPREVYAERRARLVRQTGDAIVIVPGRYSIGDEGLFKQDPNFWYLTGVESPYAILILVPRGPGGPSSSAKAGSEPRAVLFLPEKYQFAGGQYPMRDAGFRRAVWNRPVRRLAPGQEASESTGIAETYPVDEFDKRLAELAEGRTTVYLPLEEMKLYAPPGWPPPLTLVQQFAKAVAGRLPGRKLENVLPLLARMRLIKDRYELAALRRAAEISAEGLVAAMQAVRPGMNDREVAGLMEYVWKRAGSPRASFSPIVASGSDAMTFYPLRAENYNVPDRMMREGELVFIDYGAAEFQTYTSDLCRTIPVSGRFSPDQRKYYDIVLEAQEAAIAAVRPGVMMLDVIKAAAGIFRKHGLEPFEDIAKMGEDKVWGIMPSPTHYLARDAGILRYTPMGAGVRDLGHHIGLEAEDSRDYSRPLEPGMVFTIEPKIYIPEKNIAIMIEDMILVTPQGREVLSAAAPKKAGDIERLMQSARQP